ncbi:MAG: hypothetical protein QOF76_1899 [Solirubrobacteraceae bacterium]|nr:hypothetical protein [Solirubrobacteraceae bacterium]
MDDGTAVALKPLAAEITDRYARAFPDESDRYGPEWRAWCTHDNQHVLRGALDAQRGLADLPEQIAWLARLLDARGYPLARLARNLDLTADVLAESVGGAVGGAAAAELRAVGARFVDGDAA